MPDLGTKENNLAFALIKMFLFLLFQDIETVALGKTVTEPLSKSKIRSHTVYYAIELH